MSVELQVKVIIITWTRQLIDIIQSHGLDELNQRKYRAARTKPHGTLTLRGQA